MRRRYHLSLLPGIVLAGLLGVWSSGEADPGSVRTERQPLRGMTVSCPMYGQIWGSRAMAETLTELVDLGVEWVAIHPYAGVRRDGQIRWQAAAETGYLGRAVALAEEAGVRLFWKPHLAYWGSFSWRGAITYGDDEAAWQRFFTGYHRFIVDQARFAEAAGLELFAVGVELDQTLHREAEWRRLIAAVRAVYRGRITYAANWDRVTEVPFWDAVDVIGVQAYFPLSEDPAPSPAALRRGWNDHLPVLRRLAERFDKQVLFTEIGYDLTPAAASRPWEGGSHRSGHGADPEEARQLRRQLIEVALELLEGEDFLHGMFWWKWMPGHASSRDFSMRHPDARELLRRRWSGR